jgi:probable F420-dependent oxidoreductase
MQQSPATAAPERIAMKVGLFAPLTNPYHTPEYLAALGAEAEARGFHSIWVGEHVLLFDRYESAYPYASDGKIQIAQDSGLLEAFTALAYLAAGTRRIRLGTGICLVPQRNPVYTAKEAAAVDYLSHGRLDFGVGVGWLKEEFDALDVPFERRGPRCREYLEVIRRLWCDPVSEFSGEFYTLPPSRQFPKPVQQPHPPIFFGGESEAALRRVADLGQGWYGFNLSPEQAAARIGRLQALLAERGRAADQVQIAIGTYTHPVNESSIAAYRAAGADQLILLLLARTVDQLKARLDGFAENVLAHA